MFRWAAQSTLLAIVIASPAYADEGMWPFNMVPLETIQKKHGVVLDAAWLDKVMRASVRFGTAASGSFVSPTGLVLTNHHVGSECIQQLSAEKGSPDLMKDGFVAKSTEEERRCPDLELNALRSIEDVTARVQTAARRASGDQAQNDARKAEIARIEKACAHATGLRCDVVTLYSGGAYHLYRYKKYTDVRLVFAPELAVAFFGGDRDNFTYPRFCLDVALFRAYENGAPAKIEDHLRFSKVGALEGEPLFISGHPKATDRFAPVSKLELLRNVAYPFLLERYAFQRDALRAFSHKGEKQAKAARDELMSTENVIKAVTGYLGGLSDRELMNEARKREVQVIGKVRALESTKRKEYLLAAWPKLEPAYQRYGEIYREHLVLEKSLAPGGHLTKLARHLLRQADQSLKKNEERLAEYRDSNLSSLESSIFAAPPIDPELEAEQLAIGLQHISAAVGTKHPLVKKLLAGQTPHVRAKHAVDGTKLRDVELRKRLWRGGKKAIASLRDPMLELVAIYDGRALEVREQYEEQVESVERSYYGRIAEAYRAAFGSAIYPDATFTLRFNHGRVAGYVSSGAPVPWATTLGGLYQTYEKAKGEAPHGLPDRWLKAKESLDLTTPFDFVSTNDLIGGNSGSPMLSADGKVAGLIFDSNLQQLPNRFLYREEEARAVGVHARAILHTLSKVYGAEHLVQELTR